MRFFVNTKRLEPCVEVLEARPPATHRWPSRRLSCARRRSRTETLVLSRAAPVHRVFVGVVEWVEWVISRPLEGSSAHTSAIDMGLLEDSVDSLRASGPWGLLSKQSLRIVMARPDCVIGGPV